MAQRVAGNSFRSTVVCIDTYENGVPGGHFYHSFLEEGEQFHSLMQFLTKMEQLLDDMNLPQSFSAKRSFSHPPVPAAASPPAQPQQSGKLATFHIRILFRQNASWQGSVVWQEGKEEQSFRSVLELLFLMDSALNPTQAETSSA